MASPAELSPRSQTALRVAGFMSTGRREPFVEYLSGEWKVVDGNGMVYVEDLNASNPDITETLEDGTVKKYIASPTQWYWVRQSAKAILFQVANSAGQFNGYSDLAVVGSSFTATQGVSFSGSVSIANKLTSGSSVIYTAESLPQGLTLDEATGSLSGTITKSGTYNFAVNYAIDGWIKKSANYSITVAPAFSLVSEDTDLLNVNVGDDIYAEIKSDVYTLNNYTEINYTVKSGSLPEGVVLTADGELSGKPTVAGTYNVVIGVEAVKVTTNQKSKKDERTVVNDEFEAEIVVLGDAPVTVDPVVSAKQELQAKIDQLNADLAKASTKEEQTQISNQITELQQQLNALDGNTSNNALPLVFSIIAIVLAVAACGGAVFLVLKKKH